VEDSISPLVSKFSCNLTLNSELRDFLLIWFLLLHRATADVVTSDNFTPCHYQALKIAKRHKASRGFSATDELPVTNSERIRFIVDSHCD